MSSSNAAASAAGQSQSTNQKDEKVAAPPLVLINSHWLTSITSRVRSRPIPWEGYARADLVSQDELKMIRSIDGKSQADAEAVLDQRGQEYALLYLRLLSKLSRTDTLQQVLVLVGDMLQGRDDRVQLFFKAAKAASPSDNADAGEGGQWPWAPLVKLLDISDDFAQLKAAHFLALLLIAPTNSASSTLTTAPTSVITRLLAFLSSLVNSSSAAASSRPSPGAGLLQPSSSPDTYADGHGADIAIQLLEALLRTQQFRTEVWKDESRRQSEVPTSDEVNVGNGNGNGHGSSADHDEDDKDGQNDNQQHGQNGGGSSNSHKKTVKHGQAPGIIRGLVSILQAALVGPTPRGSGTATPSSSHSADSSAASVTPQMQYQVIFCFWLLSFDASIAEEIQRKLALVPLLVDVARSAVKEKVVRISIATLRNLLYKAPAENAPVMLGSKLLPLVNVLRERKWSDEDIEEDLEFLRTELSEKLNGMSTFDEYLNELASGTLSWENPAHLLDDFWKANASKFLESSSSSGSDGAPAPQASKPASEEEEGGSASESPRTPLTRLIAILRSSKDAQTLAVAAHDLGKVVQFTESGRRRVNDLGGKVEVMKLMAGHEDGEVKYQALRTVGILMSGSWRG